MARDTLSTLLAELRRIYGGRPWILATDVLQGATPKAKALRALGADDVFVIAASEGTGPAPEAPTALLGVVAPDVMSSIRLGEAALDAVPEAVQAQVDAWDPGRRARALRTLFATDAPVAGRASFGGRPAAWRALEDKIVVDALWDDVGVPRAPVRVVPATLAGLAAAHAELDAGAGTVAAADARDGFNGGATGTRWIRTADDLPAVAAWMAGNADRVRVMPFLEGVPCSIHGVVLPDGVVALRPCEMVVLRRPGDARFTYSRAATFWDPPAADREAMRAMASAVGEHLRARVGFRGTFTVDGVMTADGFRPTELNPRFGAAIAVLAASIPELPLFLAHLAVVEGEPLGVSAAALEELLLTAGDAHRSGGAMAIVAAPPAEPKRLRARLGPAGWERVADDAPADAIVQFGPAPAGGVVLAELPAGGLPVGPPVAPAVARLFAWLDEEWGCGIGPQEAARDVRPG